MNAELILEDGQVLLTTLGDPLPVPPRPDPPPNCRCMILPVDPP